MNFALIAAVDRNMGIGKNNTLPWRLPSDLKHFSEVTTATQNAEKRNAVIMGRRTWESLPVKSRPLKDRLNIVLSRSEVADLPEGVLSATSLDEALRKAESGGVENIFIIGGANLYAQAIAHPGCAKIYLTRIEAAFDCDAFFPNIDEQRFRLVAESEPARENDHVYRFLTFEARL